MEHAWNFRGRVYQQEIPVITVKFDSSDGKTNRLPLSVGEWDDNSEENRPDLANCWRGRIPGLPKKRDGA